MGRVAERALPREAGRMTSVLFHWGPVTLYTYGFFVGLAAIFALWAGAWRARAFGWETVVVSDFIALFAAGGIAGARLLYVVEHLPYFYGRWIDAFAVWQGGLSWFGGFAGAFLCGACYARQKGFLIRRVADFFAPIIAAAQGIGRLGCYFNQCCGGQIRFTVFATVWVVTAQLAEALYLFVIAFLLFRLSWQRKREGQIFFLYVFFYSIGRFLLEFVRFERTMILGFSLPQWFCAVLFVGA